VAHNLIMNIPIESIHLIERYDPLTGCGNLVSFIEALRSRLGSQREGSFSLLLLDLNDFMQINQTQGQAAGDVILRWIALVLQDTGRPVYRVGGDEFIVIFSQDSHAVHREISQVVADRICQEAGQFELDQPASIALMHFNDDVRVEPSDAWIAINKALFEVKEYGDRGFKVYDHNHENDRESLMVRGLVDMLTERITHFFYEWEKTSVLAFTDPVTGLPNSLAAEKKLRETLEDAQKTGREMAIILLDGDNLSLFNDVSYAAGDEMICNLAAVMSGNIRPDDFVARWRMGDEFVVILPGANANLGKMAAERLRTAVEAASRSWLFPVTISAGIAAYPEHGTLLESLLSASETALKLAKDSGKNRAVVAGLEAGPVDKLNEDEV
jgi:diguanylate cyclase (GGDEF)-like protein